MGIPSAEHTQLRKTRRPHTGDALELSQQLTKHAVAARGVIASLAQIHPHQQQTFSGKAKHPAFPVLNCPLQQTAPRQQASGAPTLPARPTMAARASLSIASWRMRGPRLAPRDKRKAIAGFRAAPRASRRLARFAHAISSSTPTAASSAVSDWEKSWRVTETPRAPGWMRRR